MKKTIIAAAVLATLQASAYAQSNITIYGLIDTSVRWTSNANSAGGNKLEVNGGTLSGNRWGLRGTENLGNGLNAIFLLESGFNVDTGGLGQDGRLFGRQAYVGLQGEFGSVTLGRQYSIGFDSLLRFAPLNYSNTNESDPLAAYKNAGGTKTGSRQDNMIKYRGKLGGGVSASLALAPGEVAGTNSAGRYLGGSLGYENGPLALIVFAQENKAGGTNTGAYRNFSVAGAYDFGPAIASIGYLDNKSKGSDGQVNKIVFGNVSYLVAPSVKLMLGAAQDRQSQPDGKRTMYTGVVSYLLSKRTDLYLEVDHNQWSGNFKTLADGGLAAPSASLDNRVGVAMGIRHTF